MTSLNDTVTWIFYRHFILIIQEVAERRLRRHSQGEGQERPESRGKQIRRRLQQMREETKFRSNTCQCSVQYWSGISEFISMLSPYVHTEPRVLQKVCFCFYMSYTYFYNLLIRIQREVNQKEAKLEKRLEDLARQKEKRQHQTLQRRRSTVAENHDRVRELYRLILWVLSFISKLGYITIILFCYITIFLFCSVDGR